MECGGRAERRHRFGWQCLRALSNPRVYLRACLQDTREIPPCVRSKTKAVSPLRFATALHNSRPTELRHFALASVTLESFLLCQMTPSEPGATQKSKPSIAWPRAPLHRLEANGIYFVTAGTFNKEHCFRGKARLQVLQRGLLTVARDFGWQLEAWAVFSNHYHFVGRSPATEPDARTLRTMLGFLHEKTAKWLNRIDQLPGRKVWHNYWETRLTFEKSYLARLRYTHENAVKHHLVPQASLYPWCSAAWFERTASSAQVKTIYSLKIDRVEIADDYDTVQDW
jgi:putative transposase